MPVGSAKFGLMAAAGGGAVFSAFGGLINEYTYDHGSGSKTYRTHTFRGTGSLEVIGEKEGVEVLLLAGGGGGGY